MNLQTGLPTRGLYLITSDDADTARFLKRVIPLLSHSIAILQYRNKLASTEQMREQATALRNECRRQGIVLIINDAINLAREIMADGVHLGEHDGGIAAARQQLGNSAIIGASCYNSLALAEKAAADGANYIAFGAIYPSKTKPQARHAGLDLFSQAAHLNIPMVAIGGITPDNAAQTIAAGADFIAVIGGVFDAADPFTELNTFISHF
jgi:thiamine-phosphate pyrophosphorylase